MVKQSAFFFQAEDGIRDIGVTGVQTCALPICTQIALVPVLIVACIWDRLLFMVVVNVKATP